MKMHRTICIALVFSCFDQVASAQTDANLKALCEGYWERVLEYSPLHATRVGDYRYNDRLDDLSIEARDKHHAALREIRDDAQKIPAPSLNPDDELTRKLLVRTIDDALLPGRIQHQTYLPLDPLEGPHLNLPLILVAQPFRHADDFRTYISRLQKFPRQIDDLIANLKAGAVKGIVAPCAVIQKTLPQIREHIVSDPAKSEFYKPIIAFAAKSAENEALAKDLRATIGTHIVPTYEKLLQFVEHEYMSQCRQIVGIGQVPGGDKIYEDLVFVNITVKIAPGKIHEIGLAEVARIRDEMSKVQSQAGFSGTLDQFLEHMRSDPRHRFKTSPELFQAADNLLAFAKSKMPQLFGRLPKADCVMKEIESFRAPQAPVAYYNPTPEDGSRPGYYYINLYAPQDRLRFTLEALTYHEAVPGHHLQMALDQENKSLPRFRRYGNFTAYIEGWALYTEKLGYEIGGYSEPFSRFGQLTFEMWRACRLVVDTGMHLKGWTRSQAIDFMAANTSLARLDIENEIDRYISWPGQALAYKVGELRILDMRRDAETTLGKKFDLRAFHDALLEGGAMPIDILEEKLRAWVQAAR